MSQQFFATILDADFTTTGTYLDCVATSSTEAIARTKKDWEKGKILLPRNTWEASHIDNNNVIVTFVPTGENFAAKIYKIVRKS